MLSDSRDARRYAEALLNDAPAGAAILANWHWVTPLWYLQQVEGLRPDVDVSYVYPQTDSAAADWIAAIEESIGSRPVVATRYFEQEYAQLPYRFEPLGEAFLVSDGPRRAEPVGHNNGLAGDFSDFAQMDVAGNDIGIAVGYGDEGFVKITIFQTDSP